MTLNITSKQMDITPAIRNHVEDRLTKLEKWQTQLINPHIVLSKEPQGFVADATITTPNGPLVASAKHDDMYTAVNELIAAGTPATRCSTKAKRAAAMPA